MSVTCRQKEPIQCLSLPAEKAIVAMCGPAAYAIPMDYVERCVMVPAADLQSPIAIGGRKYPLLLLDDPRRIAQREDHTTMCILCQGGRMGPVAVCPCGSLHGPQARLADLMQRPAAGEKEKPQELGCGLVALSDQLPGGGAMYRLQWKEGL